MPFVLKYETFGAGPNDPEPDRRRALALLSRASDSEEFYTTIIAYEGEKYGWTADAPKKHPSRKAAYDNHNAGVDLYRQWGWTLGGASLSSAPDGQRVLEWINKYSLDEPLDEYLKRTVSANTEPEQLTNLSIGCTDDRHGDCPGWTANFKVNLETNPCTCECHANAAPKPQTLTRLGGLSSWQNPPANSRATVVTYAEFQVDGSGWSNLGTVNRSVFGARVYVNGATVREEAQDKLPSKPPARSREGIKPRLSEADMQRMGISLIPPGTELEASQTLWDDCRDGYHILCAEYWSGTACVCTCHEEHNLDQLTLPGRDFPTPGTMVSVFNSIDGNNYSWVLAGDYVKEGGDVDDGEERWVEVTGANWEAQDAPAEPELSEPVPARRERKLKLYA